MLKSLKISLIGLTMLLAGCNSTPKQKELVTLEPPPKPEFPVEIYKDLKGFTRENWNQKLLAPLSITPTK